MKRYYIFTDGSHLKHGGPAGRLGCGGVLIDPSIGKFGQEKAHFSLEILPEFMKTTYGTSDVSNPTAEMFAILTALKEFRGSYGDGNDEIVLYSDYMGCREWLTGKWKITKPYIRAIADEINEIIRKNSLNITFEWVPGHQSGSDNFLKHWNDVVDQLAKGNKERR